MPMVLVAPAVMTAVWKLTFEPQQPLDLDKMLAAHTDLICKGILTAASGDA